MEYLESNINWNRRRINNENCDMLESYGIYCLWIVR